MNQRRKSNRRNLTLAQRDNLYIPPYLTKEDRDLLHCGEDIDVEELCSVLRSRNNRSLLEQLQRLKSYDKYLGNQNRVGGKCRYVMCLIMAIMLAKGRHCIISKPIL